MNFKQRSNIQKTTFNFQKDRLEYTFGSHYDRRGGSIPYENIPDKWQFELQKRTWPFKYICLSVIMFGMIQYISEITQDEFVSGGGNLISTGMGIALILLLCFLIRLTLRDVAVTVINLKPELGILQDHQHDVIAAEILKSRHIAIHDKMIAIDHLNTRGSESNKFRWLREENIITAQEYDDAVKLLTVSGQELWLKPATASEKLN